MITKFKIQQWFLSQLEHVSNQVDANVVRGSNPAWEENMYMVAVCIMEMPTLWHIGVETSRIYSTNPLLVKLLV